MVSDPGNVPAGYNKDVELGRPSERVTNINTQDNALGKDRLGRKSMKVDDQPDFNSKSLNENTYLKNKQF